MIAAPFLGEWGWQLMRWQAHLRFLGVETVYCQSGFSYLYEDFAEVIECNVNVLRKDKWYGEDHSDRMMPWDNADIKPSKAVCENRKLEQKFVQYGKLRYGKVMDFDILLHDRMAKRKCDKKTGDRRYKYWSELCKNFNGLKVGWVGTRAEAGKPLEIGKDLRDLPLKTLADLLANSKLIIGPSSGVMHFASLCNTPHLVWTDRRKWNLGCAKSTNYNRYMKTWNPFGAQAVVLDDEGWQPSVERVMRAIEKNHLL